jgi:hypothetical protein
VSNSTQLYSSGVWQPKRRLESLAGSTSAICIVNLRYEGTVEADVYVTLRRRIHQFASVVGRLQPILACLPGPITAQVLELWLPGSLVFPSLEATPGGTLDDQSIPSGGLGDLPGWERGKRWSQHSE